MCCCVSPAALSHRSLHLASHHHLISPHPHSSPLLLNTVLLGNPIAAGPLPPTLPAGLTALQLQGANGSALGALPAAYAALPALRSLVLRGMALSGALPSNFSSPALSELVLEGVSFSTPAPLPTEWSAFGASLKVLRLQLLGVPGSNATGAVAGALPGAWANWTALERLELSGAGGLTGALPAEWGPAAFPALREFVWSGSPNASAAWPALWALLEGKAQLQRLVVRDVGGLAGGTLDPLLPSKLVNLTALTLSGLGLAGTLPDWSAAGLTAPRLYALDLSRNALEGPLPPWAVAAMAAPPVVPPVQTLNVLPQQQPPQPPPEPPGWLLDLSSNHFNGSLPSWGPAFAGNGSHSISLANNNRLMGTIPGSWLQLALSARAVDVSGNALSGPLPATFFNGTTSAVLPNRITTFAVG